MFGVQTNEELIALVKDSPWLFEYEGSCEEGGFRRRGFERGQEPGPSLLSPGPHRAPHAPYAPNAPHPAPSIEHKVPSVPRAQEESRRFDDCRIPSPSARRPSFWKRRCPWRSAGMELRASGVADFQAQEPLDKFLRLAEEHRRDRQRRRPSRDPRS